MSLRLRLILSYFIIVAVFCGIFLALYSWLSRNRVPLGAPPPHRLLPALYEGELPPPEAAAVALAWDQGGMPAVIDTLRGRSRLYPPDAWMTAFDLDLHPYLVEGPRTFGEPAEVRRALEGHSIHEDSPLGGSSHLAPFRDGQGRVRGAVAIEWGLDNVRLRTGMRMFRLEVVTASLLGAALACLGLGALFSSTISTPLRRMASTLRQMGPERMDQRLPQIASVELALVTSSFNSMAERLEAAMTELREQKDRAVRMEASRREFLADVSHNLRTPLTAVMGWLDGMHDGLVADTPAQIRRIQRELNHVIQLLSRLLELARWEDEQPRLWLQAFSPLEAVMEVAETLEESAQSNDVQLVFESVNPGLKVTADRTRLRELFQIFLENAVEHAGPGSTVYLSMTLDGQRVAVEIRDDGRGMDPEVLENLGRRFQRSTAGGSGLGLAIAAKLVQAHGGELAIKSAPGQGTTFRFSLAQA